ncbi:histone acetyltransferase subunit nua4 protein, partial [Cardiosporidium cionae]
DKFQINESGTYPINTTAVRHFLAIPSVRQKKDYDQRRYFPFSQFQSSKDSTSSELAEPRHSKLSHVRDHQLKTEDESAGILSSQQQYIKQPRQDRPHLPIQSMLCHHAQDPGGLLRKKYSSRGIDDGKGYLSNQKIFSNQHLPSQQMITNSQSGNNCLDAANTHQNMYQSSPKAEQNSKDLKELEGKDFCLSNGASQLVNDMLLLKQKLETDIVNADKKIFELEDDYIMETVDLGNMLRGWEGYVVPPKSRKTHMGKHNAYNYGDISVVRDRLFSFSSYSSSFSREPRELSECDVESIDGSGSQFSHSRRSRRAFNSSTTACHKYRESLITASSFGG